MCSSDLSRVFVHEPPTFRWFEGGITNIAWSAVDRNIEEGRGDQVAIIGADERGGRRSVTYHELLELVRQIAAALRGLGVGRGDRVTIYMPTTIEAIATMLAEEGASVVLHGRNAERLEQVRAEFAAAGHTVAAAQGDLSTDEEIGRAHV